MSNVTTPVAGTKPGSRIRFSRGYVVTGVAHGVQGQGEVKCGQQYQAACGAQVVSYVVYQDSAWDTFQSDVRNQYGVCKKCLAKTKEA